MTTLSSSGRISLLRLCCCADAASASTQREHVELAQSRAFASISIDSPSACSPIVSVHHQHYQHHYSPFAFHSVEVSGLILLDKRELAVDNCETITSLEKFTNMDLWQQDANLDALFVGDRHDIARPFEHETIRSSIDVTVDLKTNVLKRHLQCNATVLLLYTYEEGVCIRHRYEANRLAAEVDEGALLRSLFDNVFRDLLLLLDVIGVFVCRSALGR